MPLLVTKPNCGAWPTPCAAAWMPPNTSTSSSASSSSNTSPTLSRKCAPASKMSVRKALTLKIPTSIAPTTSSGCRPRRAGHISSRRRSNLPLGRSSMKRWPGSSMTIRRSVTCCPRIMPALRSINNDSANSST